MTRTEALRIRQMIEDTAALLPDDDASKTATYTLQQIPIPNTLTFGTLTAGTNAIIMIARGKSTYNSTITATANGQTLSILSNSNRSATVYTFAKSLFNDGVYMARKEMPITISIKTTDTANNNMVIGTRRYNTTLYFPDSPPVLSGMTFTYAYASNPPGQSYINAETLTGKFYNWREINGTVCTAWCFLQKNHIAYCIVCICP